MSPIRAASRASGSMSGSPRVGLLPGPSTRRPEVAVARLLEDMVAPLLKRRSSAALAPTCWSAASSARSRCSRSRSARNAGSTRPPELAGSSCSRASRTAAYRNEAACHGGLFSFPSQWLPFGRDKLVAARGLGDVAAGGEGEVIGLDQHAVGGNTIEHPAPCFNSLWPVHVESGLPIGMPRKQIGVSHGVAHRQHGLVAGMDRESRVAGGVAVGRDGFEAGRDFTARFESP